LSKLKKFLRQHTGAKRLTLALLISIALHLVFIQKFDFSFLNSTKITPQAITVSLVQVKKPAIKKAKPIKPKPKKQQKPVKKKEVTKKIPKKPKAVKPTPPMVEPTATIEPEPTVQPLETMPSEDLRETTPKVSTPDPAAAPTEIVTEAYDMPEDTVTVPYKNLILQFDVSRSEGDKEKHQRAVQTMGGGLNIGGISSQAAKLGDDSKNENTMVIGVAEIRYDAMPNGTYTISSIMEPSFIASLIVKSNLEQKSQGTVSESGLKPSYYEYKFAKKAYSANFDWDNQKINMHTGKREKQAKISEGAQDLLSFMFQFMFVPPLEEISVSMTNGRKFKTYDYQFEGEESIKTKYGELQTIHITNERSDTPEKTELWLAIDYRNIPVKIRKTDKEGIAIEQVITNLVLERPAS